ncbi:unnamed protein product, partial [Orchesella dallaii]
PVLLVEFFRTSVVDKDEDDADDDMMRSHNITATETQLPFRIPKIKLSGLFDEEQFE